MLYDIARQLTRKGSIGSIYHNYITHHPHTITHYDKSTMPTLQLQMELQRQKKTLCELPRLPLQRQNNQTRTAFRSRRGLPDTIQPSSHRRTESSTDKQSSSTVHPKQGKNALREHFSKLEQTEAISKLTMGINTLLVQRDGLRDQLTRMGELPIC